MENLKNHDYSLPEDTTYKDDEGWFVSQGVQIVDSFRLMEGNVDEIADLRIYRMLLAYELSIATHPHFWYEYGEDTPKPTERDRTAMIAHLKFIASFTGLLHIDEISQIENGHLQEFLKFVYRTDLTEPLPTRIELKQKILEWKKEGFIIVGFQGSFDPPTETHLINATDAILLAQESKSKFKIIFIMDGDELIQKKSQTGDERPRMSINERRKILEPFWQVAGTCVSKVKSEDDWWSYVLEYHELGLDYLLFTRKHNPKLVDIIEKHSRNATVRAAKKNVIWLEEVPKGISSTSLIERSTR